MAAPIKPGDVKILLANPEPSTHGTELPIRHVRSYGEFRGLSRQRADFPKMAIMTHMRHSSLSRRTIKLDAQDMPEPLCHGEVAVADQS